MVYQGEIYVRTLSSFFKAHEDSEYIMQFTGLKDLQGKEIYEGDILTSTLGNGVPFIIKFGEYPDKQGSTNIGFYIYKSGGFEVGFGNSIYGNTDCFEVIGNIYESPELLK